MKVYYLPSEVKALVFDMDLTLYTHPEYGQYQIDSLVERLGKLRGLSFQEMSCEVEKTRKVLAESQGRGNTSLSNVLCHYGINMEENVRWREETYKPEQFIKEDLKLKANLNELFQSYILGVVTNNPVLIARRTLAALGVGECFTVLVGLDTCMVSKPHEKPFIKFAELAGCPPECCVSIGDRYDIDLDIPLKLSMGGILVDGVEDVYQLPSVLKQELIYI